MRWAVLLLVGVIATVGCGDDGEGDALPVATFTAKPTSLGPSFTPTLPPNTRTPTESHTPTPLASGGPRITTFVLSRADDVVLEPVEFDGRGRPVFQRPQGSGFSIVVEARRGESNRPVGQSAFLEPPFGPDLQILVSRPLGNGAADVCLIDLPGGDGVPATDPLQFSYAPETLDVLNDLGCRVNDGTGRPVARNITSNACTQSENEFGYGFVDDETEVQFCLPIARTWQFPPGDTVVAMRVRDTAGNHSVPQEIVIRVQARNQCVRLGESFPELVSKRPQSELLTSGFGPVSRDPWYVEPLTLCAEPPNVDGLRPFELAEPAVLGISVADGSILCAKLAPSDPGFLDCDGGLEMDVAVEQDSDGAGPGGRPEVFTNLGSPSPAGSAYFFVQASFVQLMPPSVPEDCRNVAYGPGTRLPMTTARARATIVNAEQGGTVVAQLTGRPFDCRLNLPVGWLLLPFTALEGIPGIDVANLLLLAEG